MSCEELSMLSPEFGPHRIDSFRAGNGYIPELVRASSQLGKANIQVSITLSLECVKNLDPIVRGNFRWCDDRVYGKCIFNRTVKPIICNGDCLPHTLDVVYITPVDIPITRTYNVSSPTLFLRDYCLAFCVSLVVLSLCEKEV